MSAAVSSPSDEYFMQLAIAQAAEAEQAGEVPVGAVVVQSGIVVGVGRNKTLETGDPTAHAEVIALREAALAIGNHRLDGLELFVTLEPCPMCTGAIFHSRLSRLVYGAADPKTGSAGSVINLFKIPQLNHHTDLTEGVLARQCSQQLKSFFKALRLRKDENKLRLRDDALRSRKEDFAVFYEFLKNGNFWMSSEGWRVHYIDVGDASASKTILCLHDLPFWSYQFSELIEQLILLGYRVIALDLIGCGLSDKPKKSGWHTAQNHANIINEFIKFFDFGSLRIISVGRSNFVLDALVLISDFLFFQMVKVYVFPVSKIGRSSFKKNKSIWKKNSLPFLNGLDEALLQAVLAPFPDDGYTAVLKGISHSSLNRENAINIFTYKFDEIYPLELSEQQINYILRKIS